MGRKAKITQLKKVEPFEGYFETVYAEFFKPLYLYARSIAKSDDIAKDVVSDVFFNLWKSKSDLLKIKELKSYLFRSVKNQVVRTLSYDLRTFDSLDAENYAKQVEMVNPEEILLEKELINVIEQAVKTLPAQCRLIFEMAKNQQLSYAEIADQLGVSQSTVKTQVSRAIATLKKAIESQYENKEDQQLYAIGGMCILLSYLLG